MVLPNAPLDVDNDIIAMAKRRREMDADAKV